MKLEIEINNENYAAILAFSTAIRQSLTEFENQNAAPVDDWPMTVRDLPENIANFFSLDDGLIVERDGQEYRFDSTDFSTGKDAKSAHAFAQLSRLIRHVNGGWEPDWLSDHQYKFGVFFRTNPNKLDCKEFWSGRLPTCLYFRHIKDAERSIETWRQLWLDYFQVDEQEG